MKVFRDQRLAWALQGIEREYEELDTVWYLAGSLFKNYPFDSPTEAFSPNLFRQVSIKAPCPAYDHALERDILTLSLWAAC